jgi:hypothetical protein
VLEAWATAIPAEAAGLAGATARLDLPFLEDTSGIPDLISAERRATAAEIIDQRLPWAVELLQDPASGQRVTPVELQALRIGALAVLGLPMEPFAEMGLALQEGRPAGRTMVAGYTNGCVGYVPMPAAYPLGGYEVAISFVYFRLPEPLAPQCAGLVVDQGRRLLGAVGGPSS